MTAAALRNTLLARSSKKITQRLVLGMKEETSLQVLEHMHVLYVCVLPNMIDQTIVIMLRLKDLKAQEAVLELEG